MAFIPWCRNKFDWFWEVFVEALDEFPSYFTNQKLARALITSTILRKARAVDEYWDCGLTQFSDGCNLESCVFSAPRSADGRWERLSHSAVKGGTREQIPPKLRLIRSLIIWQGKSERSDCFFLGRHLSYGPFPWKPSVWYGRVFFVLNSRKIYLQLELRKKTCKILYFFEKKKTSTNIYQANFIIP